MLEKINTRYQIELGHYKNLSPNVRLILLSYSFFLMANPLVATFINAFLWRSSENLWTIIAYQGSHIIGLPLGFYLNGLLLSKIHVKKLYFIGTLLQGINAILVVFFSANSLFNICVFGFLYGLGGGLYWANKNYLSLQMTKNSNRNYYNSIEQTIDLIINIVVPAVTGWFIAGVGNLLLFNFSIAYKIVMFVGFILLFISGMFVQFSKIEDTNITRFVIRNPSPIWQKVRLFNFLYNIAMGLAMIVSSVIVLLLVGGEGVLGTLQTITTLISAMVAYIVGRKSSIGNSWKLFGVGSLIFLAGSLTLAGIFNWIGALIYTIVVTLVWTLQWGPAYTVEMEIMDKDESDPQKQYAYICDNELFFNIGRGVGIAIVVVLTLFYSGHVALRWAPLIISIIQLPLAGIVYVLSQRLKH